MPTIKPIRKLPQDQQLSQPLEGELAAYEQVGLFQHSLTRKTAYRYRGVLLQYQRALEGRKPTVELSKQFLGHIRKQGYSPSSLRIYRAVLQGFHDWRGERLTFKVRIPHHAPPYIKRELTDNMLDLAKGKPRDQAILRLMIDAGLRRDEVCQLKVRDVGDKALRLRGKEDRDRTVPMTTELAKTLQPFLSDKGADDFVLDILEGALYRLVKRYGKLVGKPELKPHDLRHAFATRLRENGVDLILIKELLGHSSVATTQIYEQVAGNHLEDAIASLNQESRHKTRSNPNAPKWLLEIDKLAGNGKSYTIDRDGRLEEVP